MAATAAPALAQDKTFELKLSHWVPPSHPLQKALEDWGASVEKDSHGTIKSKVYPAQQLGKAFDHYDMARDGIADLTYKKVPASRPAADHRCRRAAIPHRQRQGRLAGARRLVSQIRRPRDEGREVHLAFVHDGSFHSKSKKIVVPADIKGMVAKRTPPWRPS